MKRIIITAFLMAFVLCSGCSRQQTPTEQPVQTRPIKHTTPIETEIPETVPETIPHAGTPVDTPCGVLYIPDDWDLPITAEIRLGDPMIITFFADDVKLYDLTFSESAGECIGMTQTEDGPVYVGMRIYELTEESDMLMSMQESVNILLEQMHLSEVDQVVVEETDAVSPDELQIETDIGTLVFPGKWEDYLSTELVDDYALEFHCCLLEHDPVLVFTVLLRSEDGDIISSITDADGVQHTLSVWIANPVFDESWSQAEVDTVYAMQEDLNYLLEALKP